MIGKLRTQLLVVFLFFGAINVFIIAICIIQNNKKEKIEIIEDYLHQIEVLIHSDTKEINNFFTYDTKNPAYFIYGKSKYLEKHKHQLFIINLIKKHLLNSEGFSHLNSINQVVKLSNDLDLLDKVVLKISSNIFKRGFKDYGIEGAMRTHAHNLEKLKAIPASDLLMLRRHEKDYIIRNEQKYIDLYHAKSEQLKNKIQLLTIN